MNPIETYVEIIESSYEGTELEVNVSVIKETALSAWYEVRFSRLGKTLIYHGFFLGSKHYSDEEVLAAMKDFLTTEYHVARACPTYTDFVALYGDELSETLYHSMMASAKLITEFFKPEEFMNFE